MAAAIAAAVPRAASTSNQTSIVKAYEGSRHPRLTPINVGEKLRRPERYYPPGVEGAITRFLRGCYVEFYPTESGDEAMAVECRLIQELDPVLNVVRG